MFHSLSHGRPNGGGGELAYTLLTYNLCHSDLLVALRSIDVRTNTSAGAVSPLEDFPLIARPRFNSFHPVSARLMEHLSIADALGTVSYPAESDRRVICPVGFVLDEGVVFDDWSDFHVKV